MPDPGTWFLVIKGGFNKVRECFDGKQRMRIFRVVRGMDQQSAQTDTSKNWGHPTAMYLKWKSDSLSS